MTLFTSLIVFQIFLINAIQSIDPQKPIYHLSAIDGHWINDPNGPYFDPVYQEYHLFAQYNPYTYVWGNMSWFHWTSKDMVNWSEQPVALFNDMNYDIGGAFSGSAILMNDGVSKTNTVPMLIYTCVDEKDNERQCIATSSDLSDPKQTKWQKSKHNPILDFTTLPTPYNSLNFRDPAIWPQSNSSNGYWVAMAAEVDATARIVLYSCTFHYDKAAMDFTTDCHYASTLWSIPKTNNTTIPMIECPDFYPLPTTNKPSDLMILKYSKMEDRREYYEIGRFDETHGVFQQDTVEHVFPEPLEYDYGFDNHFYASKTFDIATASMTGGGKVRRILWGWLPESDLNSEKNWSGAMALPREVTYSDVWKVLLFQPIAEMTQLRQASTHYNVNWNNWIVNGHDSASAGQYLIPIPVDSMAAEVHAVFHIDFSVLDTPSECAIEVGFISRTSSFGADSVMEQMTKQFPEVYTKHSVAIRHNSRNVSLSTTIDLSHSGGNTPVARVEKDLPGDVNAWLTSAGNHNNQNKDSYGVDVEMSMFYDYSVMEMYVFGGVSASTARVYPAAEHTGLAIYVKTCNNDVQHVVVHSLDAWQMKNVQS